MSLQSVLIEITREINILHKELNHLRRLSYGPVTVDRLRDTDIVSPVAHQHLRYRASDSKWINDYLGLFTGPADELIVASGIISVVGGTLITTGSHFRITSETGTSDDVDTITTDQAGHIVVVRPTTGHSITLKDSTGNLSLPSGDIVLDTVEKCVMLISVTSGTSWIPIGGYGVSIGTIADWGDLTNIPSGIVDISGLTPTDNHIIIGDGANWTQESGATARASLGLAIGTDIQAYDADLASIAGLTPTDGNIIVGDGATWVAESGATARTSLGLGTMAVEDADDYVLANGGTVVDVDDTVHADLASFSGPTITQASTVAGAGIGLQLGTSSALAGILGRRVGTNQQALDFWTENGTRAVRMTIGHDGDIGIGTITPAQVLSGFTYGATARVLHVGGLAAARLTLVGSNDAAIDLVDSGAGVDEKWMQLESDGGITKFYSFGDTGSIVTDNILALDHSNGYVGMGNGSPEHNLAIISNAIPIVRIGRYRSDAWVAGDTISELQFDSAISTSGTARSTVDAAAVIRAIAQSVVSSSNKQSDLAFLVKGLSGNHDQTDIEVMRLTYSGFAGFGIDAPTRQMHIKGSGQTTSNLTDAGNTGGTLYIQDSGAGVGNGGAVLLGASQGHFAAIKSLIVSGSGNTSGKLAFAIRLATGDTALTEQLLLSSTGGAPISVFSSKVGIGRVPSYELDVLGSLNIDSGVNGDDIWLRTPEVLGNLAVLRFATSGTGETAASIVADIYCPITQATPSALKGQMIFRTNRGDSMVAALVLEDNGFVGINGVTSPLAPLHVQASSTEILRGASASATGSPFISFFQTTTRRSYIQHIDAGDMFTLVSEFGGLAFHTSGGLKASIASSGELDIQAGSSSGTEARVGGVMYVTTTQASNTLTGEDDLASYTVPASTLASNGDSIWYEAWGTIGATANNKTIRLRFGTSGTTLVFDSGAMAINGGSWYVKGTIVRTGAATQKAGGIVVTKTSSTTAYTTTSLNQTLSGAIALKVTGEATATGDVVLEYFRVGFEPANT